LHKQLDHSHYVVALDHGESDWRKILLRKVGRIEKGSNVLELSDCLKQSDSFPITAGTLHIKPVRKLDEKNIIGLSFKQTIHRIIELKISVVICLVVPALRPDKIELMAGNTSHPIENHCLRLALELPVLFQDFFFRRLKQTIKAAQNRKR
jgi:hypothetical protein